MERAQEHTYLPPNPQVPDELQDKEFAALLQEEPLQPLRWSRWTEEEQVGPAWAAAVRRGWGWRGGGGGWVVLDRAVPRCLGPHSHSLAPSSEKLLPVSEQRGRAEADGERGAGPPLGGAPMAGAAHGAEVEG